MFGIMIYDPEQRLQVLDHVLNDEAEQLEEKIKIAKKKNDQKQLKELEHLQRVQQRSYVARLWFTIISLIISVIILIVVLCSF